MPDMFGYSFTPGLQRRFTNAINGQSPLTPGQSQALQVLALRLPGFLGGAAPAPDSLLRGSVGGLRPDTAVRAQVAAPVYAPASEQPSTVPPPSPLASPDLVSSLGGLSSLFAGAPNPFGGYSTDRGPTSDSGTPGKTSFHFQDEPKGPGMGLPEGTAGPGPAQGGMASVLDGVFGGGSRTNRFI